LSAGSLTLNMKATSWLIISFIVYFAVTGVTDSVRRAVLDVGIVLSFVIFFPILLVLYSFCRRRRPWAFMGTAIFGILMVLVIGVNILGGFDVEFTQWTTWNVMLINVLSVLMALEGSKAYVESKSP